MARKVSKSKTKKKTIFKKENLFKRRKYCRLCENATGYVDYKDVDLLSQFIRERAKIVPRRISGTCAHHQRQVTTAIKRARHLALLPFTVD